MDSVLIPILAIVAIVNLLLGIVILARGWKSFSYISFGAIALSCSLWSGAIIGFYTIPNLKIFDKDWIIYTHLLGITVPFLFVQFAALFPRQIYKTSGAIASIPLYIYLVFLLFSDGQIVTYGASMMQSYALGPVYPLYGGALILLFFLGYGILVQQYKSNITSQNKKQLLIVIVSTLLASGLAVIPSLILPYYKVFSLTWLGPVFTLIMVGGMFVAIVRYRLFEIKMILTEALVGVIIILSLIELITIDSYEQVLLRTGVLIMVSIAGYYLIKGVYKEVQTRERLEKLTEDLEKANLRLKELDKQKSEFIGIAAHQLRTPIAAIKGYSSLVLEGSYGKLTKKMEEAIQTIFDSSDKMADTIDDFLNVTRIEQGRMEYHKEIIDFTSTAKKSVDTFALAAKERGLQLQYSPDSCQEGSHKTNIDIAKIQHVINNLIDNAIKYTVSGAIEIILSCDKNSSTIKFSVKDTGAGMSQETINSLFDKFVRGKNAKEINVTGSGLGLYVAKQIIKAHDGKIWAESAGEGKGSTFSFELPISK